MEKQGSETFAASTCVTSASDDATISSSDQKVIKTSSTATSSHEWKDLIVFSLSILVAIAVRVSMSSSMRQDDVTSAGNSTVSNELPSADEFGDVHSHTKPPVNVEEVVMAYPGTGLNVLVVLAALALSQASIFNEMIVKVLNDFRELNVGLALNLVVFFLVAFVTGYTTPYGLVFDFYVSLVFIYLLDFTFHEQKKLTPEQEEMIVTTLYENKPKMKKDREEANYLREQLGKTVMSKTLDKFIETKPDDKEFTWDEVRKHKTKKDLWIVANGCVFDITSFFDRHPGGRKVLLTMAARDCTDVLIEFHPEYVTKMMPKFYIGRLVPTAQGTKEKIDKEIIQEEEKTSAIVEDYRKLRQILLDLNLFETDVTYYYKKFAILAVLMAGCLYFIFAYDGFLPHMMAAALLGLFWQQTAFIGHDSGHNAVSHARLLDYYWSATVGDLLMGISMGWWKLSHNVHHINCNSINDDPDIQHLPVFAVTDVMLKNFVSTYHEKIFYFDFISKMLVSYQHILFYPVMALARFNLYLQSWLLIMWTTIGEFQEQKGETSAMQKKIRDINYNHQFKNMEFIFLSGFIAWNVLLVSCLDGWVEKVFFVLLSHAISGVLHVQICLSHFTMKTYPGQYSNAVKKKNVIEDWMRLQLSTTLDVDCPEWLDFFHGGLQYQIEHHLFPRLPRHNLRLVSRLVRKLCLKHGIEHRYLSFYDANAELIERLKETAMKARRHDRSQNNIDLYLSSELHDGLNCIG